MLAIMVSGIVRILWNWVRKGYLQSSNSDKEDFFWRYTCSYFLPCLFLLLGCDCLGHIHYFDATLTNAAGEPYIKKKVVCMHEEDDGTLSLCTFLETIV